MAVKRYYWLKLKKDFFDAKEILKLRSIAGGDTYTIIYLKMLLLAMPNDGIIQYDGVGETPEEELAMVMREAKENVQVAVQILKTLELVEEINDGDMVLGQVKELTGSESKSAARVRKHRQRQQLQDSDMLQVDDKALHCNKNVTTEKEKEKELEKELYCRAIQQEGEKLHEIAYRVIARLNELNGLHYKSTSKTTLQAIKARLAEGFTEQDLITVVEKMSRQWRGSKFEQYIRPSTLFRASKFESYLNRKEGDTVDERIKSVQAAYAEAEEEVDTGDIPY